MESRETRGLVSRKVNLIEIQLECFRIMKNILFYSGFGHHRPIEMIDGYDEMFNRGLFRLSRDHRIVMDDHDLIR